MGGHSDNSSDVQMSSGPEKDLPAEKDLPVGPSVRTSGLDIKRESVQMVRARDQYCSAGGWKDSGMVKTVLVAQVTCSQSWPPGLCGTRAEDALRMSDNEITR